MSRLGPREHRPRPRKRFGQHFLEPAWADKLVASIVPRPDDRFLEIGPGAGALTLRLAPRVRAITAVELDRDMVAALEPRLPDNVSLIQQDFLDADLDSLMAAGPFRVVGNLPYNVSSPILFKLLRDFRSGARIVDATLMLQREVAERIEAGPDTTDYGVLAILVQFHADVRRVLTLPPGAFRPPPRVHSAVIRLTFRPPAMPLRDEAVFEQMVRSVFTQRRKTLANALKPFAALRHADVRDVLGAAGIDPVRRPETLTLREFGRLADLLASPRRRAGLP
jgi:16S rRNA (adenine1518-N6/adenine1519-N6)-dimethyltransferase